MFVLPSFILSLLLFTYIGLSSAAHEFFHLSEEFILIILTTRSTGDISSIFVDMIRSLSLNLKDVLLDIEFQCDTLFFKHLLKTLDKETLFHYLLIFIFAFEANFHSKCCSLEYNLTSFLASLPLLLNSS